MGATPPIDEKCPGDDDQPPLSGPGEMLVGMVMPAWLEPVGPERFGARGIIGRSTLGAGAR
jgi:hypothetical protein